MMLPREVRPLLEKLEPIVKCWSVTVQFERVVDWILQFDPTDYELASRVVQHLNVLGPEEIRSGLSIAYTRLQRKAVDRDAKITTENTLFAAIGDVGKSGAMVAYEFRIVNELPEGNFSDENWEVNLRSGKVVNVVLIDDVIGTGESASREANKVIEEATALGIKNVFVLSICGFSDGVSKVESTTAAHTFSAYTYTNLDTASVLDATLYDGLDHASRQKYLDRLKYYNRCCTRSDLGFGNVGALLAFRHNTPNVSLPIIWGTGNGWKPLFPRVGRIPGIERFYSGFAAAQKTQKELAPQKPNRNRADLEVCLLVEGKTDELLIDQVIRHLDLAKKLGVKSVATISIGSASASERLFSLLVQSDRLYILLIDDEPKGDRPKKIRDIANGVYIINLSPTTLKLLSAQKIIELFPDSFFKDAISNTTLNNIHPTDSELLLAIERQLKLDGTLRSASGMSYLVEFCLDESTAEALASEIMRLIDSYLGRS
ncbi:hypothetical protein Psta_2242 [Pirellula staleyi DSM 6068]|uniref:Phosphoribosyltransferase n=1 Tax=Pirellula staleyi (strain ATCC 27377 / DSM 6068 / ICPB 4128) TaxID=530564 RepID=D2R2S3_PIRSD|nr:hypothetical protein [Pirellula staleyi]ADB16913.1 hypothetical protein Psta_2242 [Pirellula staleyi DSM 6068]